MKNKINLEFVLRTDERYQLIRNRHYVENRGTHGQQLHFLIWYEEKIVGIISGASAVYAVKARDIFFNIPQDKITKEKIYLPSIINNTVFRLEEKVPNLATCVLSKFRNIASKIWYDLYDVDVIGFETFVVEEDWRKGTLYKADNWIFLGETAGSTKTHKGLKAKSKRITTNKKLIYCIKNKKIKIPTKKYISSWRNETLEEKNRNKKIKETRKKIINKKF